MNTFNIPSSPNTSSQPAESIGEGIIIKGDAFQTQNDTESHQQKDQQKDQEIVRQVDKIQHRESPKSSKVKTYNALYGEIVRAYGPPKDYSKHPETHLFKLSRNVRIDCDADGKILKITVGTQNIVIINKHRTTKYGKKIKWRKTKSFWTELHKELEKIEYRVAELVDTLYDLGH
jgi:hypothetical protein